MRERLLELALIEKRDGNIVERIRIIWIEFQGAAACGDRLLDVASLTAHFAEIGMIAGHVGADTDGSVHVLDRFAKLARLMRDNADHVLSLGIIRSQGDSALIAR